MNANLNDLIFKISHDETRAHVYVGKLTPPVADGRDERYADIKARLSALDIPHTDYCDPLSKGEPVVEGVKVESRAFERLRAAGAVFADNKERFKGKTFKRVDSEGDGDITLSITYLPDKLPPEVDSLTKELKKMGIKFTACDAGKNKTVTICDPCSVTALALGGASFRGTHHVLAQYGNNGNTFHY